MQPRNRSRYPVPGPRGGILIRQVVKSLKEMGLSLPLTSHILCAVSGGSDSLALAQLLVRYGRRVGSQIQILHVNHGWRGKESDADERFVRQWAKRNHLEINVYRCRTQAGSGESREDHARRLRKAFYRRVAQRLPGNALVFTGHTADDQAETRVWRFFTGAFHDLGHGILPRHGVEVRPLLGVRREELREFLREEGLRWREDRSNSDPRYLRAKMRLELMPVIERIFPGAIAAINATHPKLTERVIKGQPPERIG